MPTCREMCPIARLPEERILTSGEYPNGKPYVTIETTVCGIRVTALENEEYPGITSAQITEDSLPSCKLAKRIAMVYQKPSTNIGTERCIYVPGKKDWITVSA